eukprot:NODE_484_length_6933_cov_0.508341.p2 type:complete len:390 gc:universal NODE_484_length_6933_cov_0.508341:5321-4152(-)
MTVIGEGSFAKVNHVGKIVEKTSKKLKGYEMHEWLDEVCLLKLIQSQFVPELYDYSVYSEDRLKIRMAYAGIDLKVFYNNICQQDKERYLKDHFLQIAKALEFIHSLNIVHCDIKPRNILLSNGNIKLIDFNLSQFEKSIHNELSAYAWPYRPKEVINRQTLSCKSDIFALGVMMFYLKFEKGPLYQHKEDKPPNKELQLRLWDDFYLEMSEFVFDSENLDYSVKWACKDLDDRCSASDIVKVFEKGKRKKAKRCPSVSLSEPFEDSFEELNDLLIQLNLTENLYHLLFLTSWYTWANLNYDKECFPVMVFLIIKMLCRGDYALIHRVEKIVKIDLIWLQENVYLNNFQFLLIAYNYYTALCTKEDYCTSIFAKIKEENLKVFELDFEI